MIAGGTMPDAQIELREEIARARPFDVGESVGGKLLPRIQDDEIGRIETAADIVDADRDETSGIVEAIERFAAAADQDRVAGVRVAKAGEGRIGMDRVGAELLHGG